eukprot:c7667_g1_i3.p1 GENE.c7667_g1_i3~~c7667_g1_i3.p1  ORF type:complete len:149 (-),score=37.79 c7667_g1_i3:30-476(-)
MSTGLLCVIICSLGQQLSADFRTLVVEAPNNQVLAASKKWIETTITVLCNLLTLILFVASYDFSARLSTAFLGASLVMHAISTYTKPYPLAHVALLWLLALVGVMRQYSSDNELPAIIHTLLYVPLFFERILASWAQATLQCKTMGVL